MPEFAEFFMEEPVEALKLLTKSIIQVLKRGLCLEFWRALHLWLCCWSQAQYALLASPTQQAVTDADPTSVPLVLKSNVHARLGYMPRGVAEHNRSNISMIRSSDVGLFLQVCGTVIRTGTVRARFLCAVRHYIMHVF
jgi:hypothetical protein